MLVWLLLGSWSLAGLALVLHRLDQRHGRGLLSFYLQSLAVLDVWRGTLFIAGAGVVAETTRLTLGGLALAPRLVSPILLLGMLAVYAAEGTAAVTVLIAKLIVVGIAWGVAIPALVGLGGVLGWVAVSGPARGLLLSGSGVRLMEAVALIAGVYAAIVSYQFLANRHWRLPAWLLGVMALLVGATLQAVLFGLGAAWGVADLATRLGSEMLGACVSIVALLPVGMIYLRWADPGRSGRDATASRPVATVLRETLELRRSLAESRQAVTRLSDTLRILTEARHQIVQAVDPEALMQEICALLVRSRRYRFAWIGTTRLGDRVVVPAAQAGEGLDYLTDITVTWDDSPTGRGPMGVAIRENRALVIEDTRSDERFRPWTREAVKRGYLSVAGIPMRTGEKVVGGLAVYAGAARAFSADELDLLQGVADDLAQGLSRLRAEQLNRRQLHQLEALRGMTQEMISLRDVPRLLDRMLERAVELLEGSSGGLYLADRQRDVLRAAAGYRLPVDIHGVELRYGEGAAGKAALSGVGLIVPNYRTWPDRASAYAPDVPFAAVLAAPMVWQGEVVGVIDVLRDEGMAPFDQDDLDLLQLFASQAALAIRNASLFTQADAEQQRLRLLTEVGRQLASSADPQVLLQQAIRVTTRSLEGRSGSIFLLDPDGERLRLAASCREDGLPLADLDARLDLGLDRGLEGWVVTHRSSCLIEDVHQDDRWVRLPGIDDRGGSAICAPLLVEDRPLGVLTVLGNGPYNRDHLDLLEAISRQVALALSNAGHYSELERRLREQEAVQQVAQVISRRLEMGHLLEEVCEQVADVLRYPNVEIMLVEGEDLVMRAAKGAEHAVGRRVPLSKGIVGRVARSDRTAYVPDVRLDADYVEAIAATRSEIVVPLHKGLLVIGVLNVESPVPYGLTDDDARLLSLVGDQVSVAIENAALYDRLRRHSTDLEQTVAERTARLAEALERATEADRLKTQFVADVSHELRTPLTNIRLYLELISQASRERFLEYLETLNRETERLVDLIEDLLAISRLDAGTHPPEMAPLDLNALARGLVADRRRLFDERRLRVSFEPDPNLPSVLADGRMLSQVLANLMTNAMHYTLPGGQVALATALVRADGRHWATLRISDTGLGIPDEEQAHVFERFYRGTASRRMGAPGTGLGLSICKEILERHGGRIQLQSRAGEGSTFTLWIPAERTGAYPSSSPAATEDA